MQSVNAGYANLANYDTIVTVSSGQYDDYYKLGALFTKHESPFTTFNFYMPKTWSTAVLLAIRDMLSLNESIKFVDIREEHAKLILNFHYVGKYDERIHEISRRIKNYIDNFVHAKVSQFEIARKFHHATRQFY